MKNPACVFLVAIILDFDRLIDSNLPLDRHRVEDRNPAFYAYLSAVNIHLRLAVICRVDQHDQTGGNDRQNYVCV